MTEFQGYVALALLSLIIAQQQRDTGNKYGGWAAMIASLSWCAAAALEKLS